MRMDFTMFSQKIKKISLKFLYHLENKYVFSEQIGTYGLFRLLLSIPYLILVRRLYSHPIYFPLKGRSTYYREPIDIEDKKYYCRIYLDTKKGFSQISKEDYLDLTTEIINAEKHNRLFKKNFMHETLLPISTMSNDSVKIRVTNNESNEVTVMDMKSPHRFQYIKVPKDCSLKISSDTPFISGNGFKLQQKKDTKRKLVLMLFVDGLVDNAALGVNELGLIMPNVSKFFSKGLDFKNHYANAEWTLASVPSIVTGAYTQKHGLFHPSASCTLNAKLKTLAEYFSDGGYNTFQAGGGWRISPGYGYTKGFDRTIYKNSMSTSDVIECFIENQRSFSGRSQFSFLTFFDLHHHLNILPRLDLVSNLDLVDYNAKKVGKSVFAESNDIEKKIYIEKIRQLDNSLGRLFDHINSVYDEREITVTLFSDHGQAYLSDDKHPLSEARSHVPWLFRSPNITEGRKVDEFSENVDIFESLLNDSGLMPLNKENIASMLPKVFGGEGREYSFSQSIFPGQTYKAMFRSKDGCFGVESAGLVNEDGSVDLGEEDDWKVTFNSKPCFNKLPESFKVKLKEVW